jgi:G:T-mismatch repair DNA endonuclease (very short patch repair protein)
VKDEYEKKKKKSKKMEEVRVRDSEVESSMTRFLERKQRLSIHRAYDNAIK